MSESTTQLLPALKQVSFQSILNNLPIYCNPEFTSNDYKRKIKSVCNYKLQTLGKHDFSHLDQFIKPKPYLRENDYAHITFTFAGQNKYKQDLDGFSNMENEIQKILLYRKTDEGRQKNIMLDNATNQTTFLFTNICKIYGKALKIAQKTFMKSVGGMYDTDAVLNNKPPFGDETKQESEITEKD